MKKEIINKQLVFSSKTKSMTLDINSPITDILTPRRVLRFLSCQKLPDDYKDNLFINNLICRLAEPIISKYATEFNVTYKKPKGKPKKLGTCYSNAAKNMPDYGYVEGYIKKTKSDAVIAHSWNVDKEGNHYDFTLPNSGDYNYFGVILPDNLVYSVGYNAGKVWFAVLPFISLELFEEVVINNRELHTIDTKIFRIR